MNDTTVKTVVQVISLQNLDIIPVLLSDAETSEDELEDEFNILLLSKRRKLTAPNRIQNYIEITIPRMSDKQFQQNFRVTKEAFENLVNLIGPQLKRQAIIGRSTINVEKQILATLWILATPDSYRSIGERFNMAKSSLSVCFMRVIKILNSLAPRIIKWPEGQRLIDIQTKFYNVAHLQKVIGAVDGTYIVIKAPKEDPQSYITRKCHYAFTLQAIADPNLMFTDVFISYPGSVSDARIFKNSDIYHTIENNIERYCPENSFIIGDKAYPVLQWCIPPYIHRGNLNCAQMYFNTIHARTRQVIERTFALLFGRFRRLKYLDMNRHDLIPGAVLAACVLHNICLSHEDLFVDNYIQEGIDDVVYEENNENINLVNEEGRNRRNEICRQMYVNRNLRQ